MARMLQHHKELDSEGKGKCSVPMWRGGVPDGFCDEIAYGKRPEGKTLQRWDGYEYRLDGLYSGYVPGLACPMHGGPKGDGV
jgi:serine protease inhibitor ecotin